VGQLARLVNKLVYTWQSY